MANMSRLIICSLVSFAQSHQIFTLFLATGYRSLAVVTILSTVEDLGQEMSISHCFATDFLPKGFAGSGNTIQLLMNSLLLARETGCV